MIQITPLKDGCRSIGISLNYCSYIIMFIDNINVYNRIDIERLNEF